MIRLLRAEALRLLSRRFTVITLLVVLLAIGAFQIQVYFELRRSAGQPRWPRPRPLRRVTAATGSTTTRSGRPSAASSGLPVEQCAVPEPTARRTTSASATFATIATVSVTAGHLSGRARRCSWSAASFIGAEFSSGSIGNWLSFVPRRNRVFVAKLLAIVGFAAAGRSRRSRRLTGRRAVVFARAGDVPDDRLRERRSAWPAAAWPLPVVLAVLGFAIGLVARHTAAAIGVLLGYLVVWFVRNAVLGEQAWAQKLTPWSPEGNMAAPASTTAPRTRSPTSP